MIFFAVEFPVGETVGMFFFGSSSGPAVSYHGSGGWIPSDFDGFG